MKMRYHIYGRAYLKLSFDRVADKKGPTLFFILSTLGSTFWGEAAVGRLNIDWKEHPIGEAKLWGE